MATRRETGYKELTLQQMRSFFYTVELGSFSAAAQELGLSHPTVWHQVHALQKRMNVELVEPGRMGCTVTMAGQILANLIAPIVHSSNSLRSRFDELLQKQRPSLIVAATPRITLEDLPRCLCRFRQEHPDVDLLVYETTNQSVAQMVIDGEAHLGIAHMVDTKSRQRIEYQQVDFVPAYNLDVGLFLPLGHRLCGKTKIRVQDLKGETFLNRTESMRSLEWEDFMQRNRLLQVNGSCCIQAEFAATLMCYIAEGFGVAFSVLNLHSKIPEGIVVKSVTHLLGQVQISFVRRRGSPITPQESAFQATVQQLFQPTGPRHKTGKAPKS
jgi:DNA-binding transcriptional LysR family regulator